MDRHRQTCTFRLSGCPTGLAGSCRRNVKDGHFVQAQWELSKQEQRKQVLIHPPPPLLLPPLTLTLPLPTTQLRQCRVTAPAEIEISPRAGFGTLQRQRSCSRGRTVGAASRHISRQRCAHLDIQLALCWKQSQHASLSERARHHVRRQPTSGRLSLDKRAAGQGSQQRILLMRSSVWARLWSAARSR